MDARTPASPTPDPVLCAALAADLRAAGFTASALRSAWGGQADAATARGLRSPALTAIADRQDAVAVLGRLLALGVAQPVGAVDASLPRCRADGLVELGLARRDGGGLVPLALIRPQAFADLDGVGEWWIASDLDEAALGGPLPEGHVLGVGGASLTLAALQLTVTVARVLDVGSGCGIQSLRARRAAQEVVATDVSQRALAYTELNALLNGVDGIRTVRGSLFDPVAGERFDRVVSNPPFVITPRVAGVPSYEYRDGGMAGDDLVAAFVRGVASVLSPGGVAQLLGNWEHRDGMRGLDRVRQWVEASEVPLDAWIVEREVLDPIAYAELWIRDGGTAPGDAGYADLVDAWLTDFSRRGVTEVGFGYLLLRRPASGAPTLTRYERIPQHVDQAGLGAHLAAALAAHDRLTELDDEGLAASVLVVAPDVTEARHHMPGEEAPTLIELRQGGGFARSLSVDPALAALVGACDGDLEVGTLIAAIADLLEADAPALRADLLPRVRELVFTGFLRFA
jgi:methylase of polypeptide subunit release factors